MTTENSMMNKSWILDRSCAAYDVWLINKYTTLEEVGGGDVCGLAKWTTYKYMGGD